MDKEDLQCWYKALDLEPGASLEEVNQAHKDLALVWHPDRLPQDSPRLQEKAQAKLKEINNARDRLREYQADRANSNGNNGSSKSTRSSSSSNRESAYQNSQRQQPRRASTYRQDPQPPERQPEQTPVKATETNSYQQSQATSTSRTHATRQTNTSARTPPQRPDLSGVDWSVRI